MSLPVELRTSPCCDTDLLTWATVEDYPIERCARCGSGYVNPRPDLDELESHYADGGHGDRTVSSLEEVLEAEERYPNSTVDAERILGIVSEIAPGKRLLDVGSGYGFFTREACDRGFDVDALELAEFERECTRALAGVEPEPVAFERFEGTPRGYDAILMSQILEHAVDPAAWLEKARRLLSPGGVLAVALPNFDSFVRLVLGTRDPMVQPPDHLNYWNRKGLVSLLTASSLSVMATGSVSRLPGSVLTDRVAMPEFVERPMERLFQRLQHPMLAPLDTLDLGMFLNVYAVREPDS